MMALAMARRSFLVLLILIVWAYVLIFQFPYAVWEFPLTQNWFTDNGLVMFRDIIYHHTQLPLFILYGLSKVFGNSPEMLRVSSLLLAVGFGYGVYLSGNIIAEKVGKIALLLFLVTFPPLFNNFNIEEMTASLFGVYALFFFLKFLRTQKLSLLAASGFSVILASMGKQAVVGLIPAFFFAFLGKVLSQANRRVLLIRGAATFIVGGFVAVLPFLFYYVKNSALDDFWYWNVTYNLTVYPKIYAQQTAPVAFGEGITYSAWLFLSLIPAAYLFFFGKLTSALRLTLATLTLATIFLIPSLLPSFHVYKILSFYPYPLLIWTLVLVQRKSKILLLMILAGVFTFLIPAKTFYLDYAPANFRDSSFISNIGENELAVVSWLKENTQANERIMNMGQQQITTLAKRLPANRYVYIFPWLISPYEQSTTEILRNPPRVVVIDNQTIEDFPSLKDWQFLQYVWQKYQKTATYGTYDIFVTE